MKAQILAAREAFPRGAQVPIQVSVTLDPNGRMLLGTDIAGRSPRSRRCTST